MMTRSSKSTTLIRYPHLITICCRENTALQTELACAVIRRFSRDLQPGGKIIGLKVSTWRAGEEDFHGRGEGPFPGKYILLREENRDGPKETMRFLAAGASGAYLLRVKSQYLAEGFAAFLRQLRRGEAEEEPQVIAAISCGLASAVEPGLVIPDGGTTSSQAIPSRIVWSRNTGWSLEN